MDPKKQGLSLQPPKISGHGRQWGNEGNPTPAWPAADCRTAPSAPSARVPGLNPFLEPGEKASLLLRVGELRVGEGAGRDFGPRICSRPGL